MEEIRFCPKHGYTLHSEKSSGGWRCRKCSSEAVQRRRIKLKLMAIDYKGGKCEKCGYEGCPDALEFHHLDPNKKDFGIGEKGYTRSFEEVKKELDKCILLCCRCHRELHYDMKDKSILSTISLEKKEKKVKPKKEKKIILKSELISALINGITFSGAGRILGITDNAVRKRCKKFGIPIHTNEMQEYLYNNKIPTMI